VLLVGGTTGVDGAAKPERYDPASNSWHADALPRMAYGQAVTALADGRVLAAGGYQDYGPPPAQPADAEVYDPTANTWTPTGPMPDAGDVKGGTATRLLDGRVLVVGERSAQIYDPATNRWAPTARPTTLRTLRGTATRLQDGSVLVAGGVACTPRCVYSNLAEVFTP
jgi:N-acetylneuraminic acid mutarotase